MWNVISKHRKQLNISKSNLFIKIKANFPPKYLGNFTEQENKSFRLTFHTNTSITGYIQICISKYWDFDLAKVYVPKDIFAIRLSIFYKIKSILGTTSRYSLSCLALQKTYGQPIKRQYEATVNILTTNIFGICIIIFSFCLDYFAS